MKIKICGITNLEDALAAARLGVDYLGFISNSKSPRKIELLPAKEIIETVKKDFPNIRFVLVTVNENPVLIEGYLRAYGFDVAQLHGEESIEECRALAATGEIWKAIIVKASDDLAPVDAYRTAGAKILFDSGRGSGMRIPIDLLMGQKIDILAGGIGPDIDLEEIRMLSPDIVDINSKIESSPGKKDHALMAQTIKKLRS